MFCAHHHFWHSSARKWRHSFGACFCCRIRTSFPQRSSQKETLKTSIRDDRAKSMSPLQWFLCFFTIEMVQNARSQSANIDGIAYWKLMLKRCAEIQSSTVFYQWISSAKSLPMKLNDVRRITSAGKFKYKLLDTNSNTPITSSYRNSRQCIQIAEMVNFKLGIVALLASSVSAAISGGNRQASFIHG